MMDTKTFGDKLKTMRKNMKMTQEELGNRLNLSKAIVSSYEKGQKLPSYETLFKIIEIFDTSFNELFGIKNDKKIPLNNFNLTHNQIKMIKDIIDEFQFLNNLK